jgi:hypothetical protein
MSGDEAGILDRPNAAQMHHSLQSDPYPRAVRRASAVASVTVFARERSQRYDKALSNAHSTANMLKGEN